MNDSALKSFCTWARTELIKGVEAQMVRYGITEPAPAPVGSETVNGLPLSPAEIEQRDELLRMQAEVGHEALRDRAAYTWFNRIVAIRFMDACGWLPSRMRMLSRADGSHGSEAVENALDVEITTADTDRIAELKMAGLDEPLWRYLFVAQCEELADCLPGVFERVGGAMELLLPQGLMMADSVVGKLNAVLTDEDWREGVTVLGWMYQYYNADVKDEFFKSKRKVAAADIAPATQLFTPEWIVRYMVENSLGRLWMLNNPGSSLRERMEYYIEPDAEHEDFIRISSPEEITLCDPHAARAISWSMRLSCSSICTRSAAIVSARFPSSFLLKTLQVWKSIPARHRSRSWRLPCAPASTTVASLGVAFAPTLPCSRASR